MQKLSFCFTAMNMSSVTLPNEQSEQQAQHETPPLLNRVVGVSILALLILATIVLNSITFAAFAIDRHLRYYHDWFILNLAVADLSVGIVSMPFDIVTQVTGHWHGGHAFCIVWLSLDFTITTTCVLCICVVAVDRYLQISHPIWYISHRKRSYLFFMLAAPWCSSILLYSPSVFLWEVFIGKQVIPDDQCFIPYYNVALLVYIYVVLEFVVPLCLLVVTNVLILITVHRRLATQLSVSSSDVFIRPKSSSRGHSKGSRRIKREKNSTWAERCLELPTSIHPASPTLSTEALKRQSLSATSPRVHSDSEDTDHTSLRVHSEDTHHSSPRVHSDDTHHTSPRVHSEDTHHTWPKVYSDDAHHTSPRVHSEDTHHTLPRVYSEDTHHTSPRVHSDDTHHTSPRVHSEDTHHTAPKVHSEDTHHTSHKVLSENSNHSDSKVHSENTHHTSHKVYSEDTHRTDPKDDSEDTHRTDPKDDSEDTHRTDPKVHSDDTHHTDTGVYSDDTHHTDPRVYSDDTYHTAHKVYSEDTDSVADDLLISQDLESMFRISLERSPLDQIFLSEENLDFKGQENTNHTASKVYSQDTKHTAHKVNSEDVHYTADDLLTSQDLESSFNMFHISLEGTPLNPIFPSEGNLDFRGQEHISHYSPAETALNKEIKTSPQADSQQTSPEEWPVRKRSHPVTSGRGMESKGKKQKRLRDVVLDAQKTDTEKKRTVNISWPDAVRQKLSTTIRPRGKVTEDTEGESNRPRTLRMSVNVKVLTAVIKYKKQVNNKLVTIANSLFVLMFVLLFCWLPSEVYKFIVLSTGDMNHNIHSYTTWLLYSNAAINPALYPLLYKRYNCAYAKVLKKLRKCFYSCVHGHSKK